FSCEGNGDPNLVIGLTSLTPFIGRGPVPALCPPRKGRAAFKAKIGAGMPDSVRLAALPSGLVILRPVPAPIITRTFLISVRLSPPACERLRNEGRSAEKAPPLLPPASRSRGRIPTLISTRKVSGIAFKDTLTSSHVNPCGESV